MSIRYPFVRWGYQQSYYSGNNDGFYLLYTASGSHAKAVEVIRNSPEGLVYKACDFFVRDYGEILPLGSVLRWKLSEDMSAWLDSVVYHSFVRYSVEGVARCWYLQEVKPIDCDQTLPLALRLTYEFDNTTKWIVFRNGPKAWPVEIVDNKFGRGWPEYRGAHGLDTGYKIILSCERRWIFNTIIFNENDTEVRYYWTNRGFELKNLHPPPGGLRTGCLPSNLQNQITPLKFGVIYGPRVDLLRKFQDCLARFVEFFQLPEIVVKMAQKTWTITVENMRLQPLGFQEFISAIGLEYFDYIVVAVSPAFELQVVVIGTGDHQERHYEWMKI